MQPSHDPPASKPAAAGDSEAGPLGAKASTAPAGGPAQPKRSEQSTGSAQAKTVAELGATEMFGETAVPPDAKPQSGKSPAATELFTETPGQKPPGGPAGQAKPPGKPQPAKPMAATGEFVETAPGRPAARTVADAAKAATRPPPPKADGSDAPAETIADFKLVKKLGEGGMGAVYRAHQISMDRVVALKLLAKQFAGNQPFVERFYREARTMAKLDHPNIVRGYAVGEANGQHYVAMEFIDGASMQKWMDQLGKLSVGDAVHVVLRAADALQHAHELNLIHRDIKPDNILITSKGVVKVADLGLAKKTDEDLSLTQSGTGFGTPFYMPLEQYRDAKHVDARADIYALGVTLYYLLTGKLPFTGETHVQVIEAKQVGRFAPARKHNPEIPERLDLMIDKMMQKEPGHRYQSCAEVIRDLDSLGLASEYPSFVGAAAATAAAAARPSPTLAKVKTAPPPASADDRPERELWLLRYTDERGQKVKKQVSTGRLKQLIERGEIDVKTATVMRGDETKPRSLASVGEFASLVQSKMVQAKADRRSQKLGSAYEKLERQERRRQMTKLVGKLVKLAIVLAVLAGVAIGGWILFKNRDTLIQDVQSVTGGQNPAGPQPDQK